MIAPSTVRNGCTDEYEQLFKGIGHNHQKDMDRSMNKSLHNESSSDNQKVKQRFQISTAHDWKTEIFKAPSNEVDPKEMQKQQQRSDMDSKDLVTTLK